MTHWFVFALLFVSLSVVSGHNWVGSPSRSFRASTVRPALSRRSEKPHVQIAKGQVRAQLRLLCLASLMRYR